MLSQLGDESAGTGWHSKTGVEVTSVPFPSAATPPVLKTPISPPSPHPPTNQKHNKPNTQPINQPNTQPHNQPTNQPTTHTTNQTHNQSTNQSNTQLPNDTTQHATTQTEHTTATGNNCCNYGDRIPGLWFWPGTRKVLLVDGHTADGNSHTGQWKCDDKLLTLQPNKNYRLRMVFKLKFVSLYVNGAVACKEIPRVDRKEFKDVQVYMSDPWHNPAKASVKNLYFKPL